MKATEQCTHEWIIKSEHIRRFRTPEQEKHQFKINQMYPDAANHASLSATLKFKECTKCKAKQNIDYKVN